jgi:Mn2+/Fe2+ NRAMP family transporter
MMHMPLGDNAYLYLVAANIGSVIMPWMIFYQQSAVADKKLQPHHYKHARWDTAIGSLITQAVMAAILVTAAATIGQWHGNATLNSIGDITKMLVPFLGADVGRVVFSLGTIGAALVAAIVASLASAWGFGEVTGYRHSLEHRPLDAPWFYGIYSLAVIGGAVVVDLAPNLVELNIGVEVMNALMLPLVLGFLVALAFRALPPERRLRGVYAWVVVGVALITAGLGVYGGITGAQLFCGAATGPRRALQAGASRATMPLPVPLIGARRREQLTEALGALPVRLTSEDLAAIERAVPQGAAAGERYAPAQMAHLDSERG